MRAGVCCPALFDPESSPESPMSESLKFLTAFLRNPNSIGAVTPSSRRLAKAMTRQMGIHEANVVVELGPGTGAFTSTILDEMRPQGHYLAVELNEDFARRLTQKHPGLDIVVGSAEKLDVHLERFALKHADSVICGLPWAAFRAELQESIMKSVVRSLPEGGRFATFAYIHSMWFPAARRFRHLLEANFQSVETSPIIWRNLPPAFVYRCSK